MTPSDAVQPVQIGDRLVGPGEPVYVIAELSANHQRSLDVALEVVRAAAEAGADAVKLQTYTADTMTIDCDEPPFIIGEGTIWEGRKLYDLYEEAHTPWEWHDPLAAEAERLGLDLFSTPFDQTALDFLEERDPPCHKIASFELVDIPLIRAAAATGRPLIMSTGMATAEEIDEAVEAATESGDGGVVLLRCNSGYPAEPTEMDLRTITDMVDRWGLPIGLSDHTTGTVAASAAVALGAVAIEKHLTLDRSAGGPDAAFSLEPHEFADMVSAVRETEAVLGNVRYGPSEHEKPSLAFRRSLWIVKDVAEGEVLTEENVRAIRPAGGLAPKYLDRVVGRQVSGSVEGGAPVTWGLLGM